MDQVKGMSGDWLPERMLRACSGTTVVTGRVDEVVSPYSSASPQPSSTASRLCGAKRCSTWVDVPRPLTGVACTRASGIGSPSTEGGCRKVEGARMTVFSYSISLCANRRRISGPDHRGRKHIARAVHRLDDARGHRVDFDLAAQARDAHVDAAVHGRQAAVADELLAGEDLVGALQESAQDRKSTR